MSISPEIIVASLALLGTAFGSIIGVLTANKLTIYRIEQLEKKVDKHNHIVERTGIIERDLKTCWKQIDELKEEIKEEAKQ